MRDSIGTRIFRLLTGHENGGSSPESPELLSSSPESSSVPSLTQPEPPSRPPTTCLAVRLPSLRLGCRHGAAVQFAGVAHVPVSTTSLHPPRPCMHRGDRCATRATRPRTAASFAVKHGCMKATKQPARVARPLNLPASHPPPPARAGVRGRARARRRRRCGPCRRPTAPP